MEKTMLKKLVSLFVVLVFATSFVSVAFSEEQEVMTVNSGKIISVTVNTGEVVIAPESGETLVLMAGPDIDLKALAVDDEVIIEYDNNNVLKSINKKIL